MHKVEMADLLLAITQHASIGIIALDHSGKIIICNDRALNKLNITTKTTSLAGSFLSEKLQHLPEIKRWLELPPTKMDNLDTVVPIDGKHTDLTFSCHPFLSGCLLTIEHLPSSSTPATLEKNQKAQNHDDALTGIPNRAHFMALSDNTLAHLSSHDTSSLIIIDLKGLDQVNAALGHDGGDALLQYASQQLKRFCEVRNSLYARIGGDKFCILHTDKKRNHKIFKQYIQSLQQTLSEPTTIRGFAIAAACSIGTAADIKNEKSTAELLMQANIACHRSKIVGYPVAYEESLKTLDQNQLKLNNDLKNALAKNQFLLYLQPTLDLNLEKITTCEALIRWRHPELGILLPHDFLPILEKSELVHDALIQILEIAMSHICTLDKNIQVAVNFSPKNLCAPHLLDKIKNMLNKYQVKAELLCIELTETAMMTADDSVRKTLTELRSLGIKIALDDYGTGYSTLSRLKSLPVDQIKIDRSFVCNMHFSPRDKMIISSTIELAKNLDLEVVVEGVEHKKQKSIVRELGADFIQGYYLSTPKPIDEIKPFILQFNDS